MVSENVRSLCAFVRVMSWAKMMHLVFYHVGEFSGCSKGCSAPKSWKSGRISHSRCDWENWDSWAGHKENHQKSDQYFIMAILPNRNFVQPNAKDPEKVQTSVGLFRLFHNMHITPNVISDAPMKLQIEIEFGCHWLSDQKLIANAVSLYELGEI